MWYGWVMITIGGICWLVSGGSLVACWLSEDSEKRFAMGEADAAYITAIFFAFIGFMFIAPGGAVLGWWH